MSKVFLFISIYVPYKSYSFPRQIGGNVTKRMDMYGGAGDRFVMLYARYLATHGKRVLVVDVSEERRLLEYLPLPEEPLDCLFYQGVDYRIREVELPNRYDVVLYYWGESLRGGEKE